MMQSFEDFSFVIPETLNSEVIYDNKFGLPTIGFTLTVPTGGTVLFEGSFDGITYNPITMRSVALDSYSKSTTISDSLLGSIGALRSVKLRVIVAGSAPGVVTGRANAYVSTIEGQEHGFPPHKRGFITRRKDFTFVNAQTGTDIWVPAAGKRFIVTSYSIFASGTTDSTVIIFDQSDIVGNRLLLGFFDVTVNSPISVNSYMGDSPFISGAPGNALKVTTTAAINIFGVLFGYEI
jgi:hypothetical protein